MSGTIYLTKERVKEIEEELNHLKTVGRRETAQKIADARSHGDLSENADYDAAREEQGLMELKIQKLSQILANSQVIEASEFPDDKVYILSKVKVVNVATNDEFVYTLVSDAEADFESNKISVISPLGKALMGKELGDIATMVLPNRQVNYKILEISK